MNKSIILALLVALVCMAAPAMAQPAPFVISGHIFDADNNPCNGAWVRITNVNTSVSWDAENDSASNYYQLVLNSDNVSVNNILSIEASGCSQPKTVEHTVTQGEIDDGGFSENITLEAAGEPDLTVESITPNCGGYLFGNESNEICAVIKNNGTGNAGASHACFVLNGYSETVTVSALAAGANETVCITDPTIRAAGAAVTITVTADCDDEVAESNETNNVSVQSETVVNNGYKGKRYTGGEDITTLATYDINGNLVYSVGDSYYLGGYSGWSTPSYTANWTASDLPVPAGATVKEVRLYVPYCFDYQGDMPDNLSLKFNGNAQTLEKHYTDRKSHGDWDNPYGMLAYNVTDDFDTGGNTANLTNSNPKCGEQRTVSIRGMILVVIYEDATEPQRQIFVGEEFDLLYGGSGKCTTPEEATAWAPITGPSIDTAAVASATLITVAPGADPNEGDLIFNGHVWNDVWNFAGSTELGIDERDVASYLEPTDNLVGFQSSDDYMEASNAFLVVELEAEPSAEPDLTVESITPNCGGYLFGNESNEICAVIKNNGTGNAGASHACFVLNGYSETVTVSALAAGANETVCITDPTIRAAGAAVTITVTADCDDEVAESNETNNATVLDVTVVNNGYKGKIYTDGENMTTWKSYDLNGNLVYSVGDSYYLSSSSYPHWTTYNTSWTATDLPVTGAVVEARLYTTYTWDKDGVMPNDVSMSFNGVAQTQDAHYWDDRVFPDSKPYGMLAYNVTDDFDTSGNYANLTNSHIGGNNVSMRGMLLVVVYENASEPQRLIYVNEEFDLLYGGSGKCTTPEEATAWAPITGSIDTAAVASATLITVAPGAGPNEGELIFNGHVWNDVWSFAGANGSQIGIDERDVTDNLTETDNLVGFRSSEDWMEASNAFLVVELEAEPSAESDLTVESITPNCGGYLFGNESNEICAVIKNNGTGNAGASNACFVLNGYSETVTVSALAAGANETVCITDPTIRAAGAAVTITVTADCDGEIAESNETNNATVLDVTVLNNGYKGKIYTGGENITTLATYDLNGNLIYSVGDSYYLGGYPGWSTPSYTANWTAGDLPVPAGATVEEVRLYVPYCFDYQGDMPDNLSLKFNGNAQTLEQHYTDRKSHGDWDYQYGMLTYNVTDDFDTGGNIANLTNSNPKCGEQRTVSIRGMILVVIYNDASEPRRQIFVGEEFDLLYGGSGKCTTPEEATAWAPITGPAIDLAMVADATLITVAPGAGPTEGELLFNGQVWNDVWNFAGATELGIDEHDVKPHLRSTENLVGFQSSDDYMEASNAFLVVEYGEVPVSCELSGVGRRPGHLNSGDDLTLTARVKNTGGYLVYCQMEWQVINESGAVVETIFGDAFTEEAGNGPAKTSKLWTVDLDAGSYTVEGILHYGATAGNLDCTDGQVDGGKFTVV